MALFANKSHAYAGPAYDVRPAKPKPTGNILAPIGFVKNVCQGACAGLLTLLGAMHLTSGVEVESTGLALLTNLDAGTLSGVTEQALSGGAPGIIEIIGAAALFVNAGDGWARILGLLGFVIGAVAYANGVEATEFVEKMADLYDFARANVDRVELAQQ